MTDSAIRLLLRWFINGLGIWAAARLLSGVEYGQFGDLVAAALIFSLINATIRPVIVILSLPAIVLTLGLFTLIVNALMVYLTSVFYAPFDIAGFSTAIFAAIIIGLVNYLLSLFIDDRQLYVQTRGR